MTCTQCPSPTQTKSYISYNTTSYSHSIIFCLRMITSLLGWVMEGRRGEGRGEEWNRTEQSITKHNRNTLQYNRVIQKRAHLCVPPLLSPYTHILCTAHSVSIRAVSAAPAHPLSNNKNNVIIAVVGIWHKQS